MTDETDKPRRGAYQRREDEGERRPRSGGGEGGRFTKRPFNRREEPQEEAPAGERIAKRLARAGISSRREAEALITDGRVRVNGQVLSSPAFNVQPGDRIELDGQTIPEPERTRLFLFHKPAGVVSTNRDPEGRKTVFDVLPEGLPRVMSVGRLDINTEGLLLLTNDGGLARVLELPETGWLRRYRVRVHGAVDEDKLKGLREGIAVEGVFYGAIEAELERTQGSNAWLTLGLREGKNREVKNVLGALGLEVNRLIRVSYGPFQLGELEEAQVQEIKGRTLRDQLGERLIEESGADFEAEVRQPFSNRPMARGQEPATPAPRREAARPEPGEGGLIKNRKRERERFRADGLERLGTRPDRSGGFGAKPFGGKGFGQKSFGKAFTEKKREAEERYEPRTRSANVWMGPGARPQGAKAAAAPRPERRDDERPFKPRYPRPEGESRSGQERDGRRDAEPRDGERRPWQPRERREEAAAGGENRQQREFRPRRPREGENEFRSRPPRDGESRGEGRDFRPRQPREGGGEFRPRREGAGQGKSRQFRPRPPRDGESQGERREFRPRPPREGGERREGFNAGERRESRPRFEGEARPQRREGENRESRPRFEGERPRRFEGEGTAPRQDGERPPRRFDERPRENRGGEGRPFRERPSGDRPRTFSGEGRPEGAKPYRSGPRPEGAAKPYRERPRTAEGERPNGNKPFRAGPRPEGGAKPYRPADGERPFNKRPRPAGGDRPERREGKPSGYRPSGGRPGGDRPGGGGAKRPFKPRGDR